MLSTCNPTVVKRIITGYTVMSDTWHTGWLLRCCLLMITTLLS